MGPQRELAGGPASAGAGAAGGEQGSVLECCPAARRHSPAQASITHFTSYHHNISHSSRDAGRGWRRWRAWAAPPPTTPPPWTCLSSAAPLATRRCAALTDGGCLVARVWVQAVPRALVGEVGSTPGSGIERKGRRFSDAGLRCPPAQLSAAQLTSQRARAPCPPRPPARPPTRAQKLEGRCRKDGPQAAFTRLEHTEVPALRAHVHDTARRCAHVSCVVPAAGGRAPRGAAAAGQGWGVGRRKGAGAGVGAAAGAAAGAQPWRSLPAPWGQPWGQPWGRPRSRSRSCSRRPCHAPSFSPAGAASTRRAPWPPPSAPLCRPPRCCCWTRALSWTRRRGPTCAAPLTRRWAVPAPTFWQAVAAPTVSVGTARDARPAGGQQRCYHAPPHPTPPHRRTRAGGGAPGAAAGAADLLGGAPGGSGASGRAGAAPGGGGLPG